MKALFGRKVLNIKELKELTILAKENGMKGENYKVVKEIVLSDDEFNEFTSNFSKDQEWISQEDGGCNEKGDLRCIRVIDAINDYKILVNSEGYTYPRYVALEETHKEQII